MVDRAKETEFKLWVEADNRQKSFLVQILHWFHYRPTRLRASWKQEEVLTWELIHALRILPQSTFVHPLLRRIAALGGGTQAAVAALLGKDRIQVTPYPSLELGGSKRNCKSDIGLGREGRPTIWIEAKTASFKAVDLEEQLQKQQASMTALMPETETALVTLLPRSRALQGFPNLSWDDVLGVLHSCHAELVLAIPDTDMAFGYRAIATELAERIESHPNRPKGWV